MNLLEWIKKLKKTDLFKSVSIVTLGGIAINFAQLVFVMILSRIISPKEFGIVSSLMIFVNFMNVINQLGIGSALIQKSHITETNIKFSYTFSMILSVFLGIIYILAMPFYLSYIDLQYILPFPFILFFYFPLKGLSSVAEALLMRKGNFKVLVYVNLISFIVGYGGITIFLALNGWGYRTIIIGYLIQFSISAIFYYFYSKPQFLKISKLRIEVGSFGLVKFGIWQSIGTIFTYIAGQMDYLFISKVYGKTQLGFYHKSFQLYVTGANFLENILEKVFFPFFSRLQNRKKRTIRLYYVLTFLCLFGLGSVAFLLNINAKLIVVSVLGGQWIDSVVPFSILIWALPFRVQGKVNKVLLKARGKVKQLVVYQLLFVIFLALSIYIFKSEGIVGVSKALLYSVVFNTITTSLAILKILSL